MRVMLLRPAFAFLVSIAYLAATVVAAASALASCPALGTAPHTTHSHHGHGNQHHHGPPIGARECLKCWLGARRGARRMHCLGSRSVFGTRQRTVDVP